MRQLVESGEYFKQSREWYNEIYIVPLSIKYFYLIYNIFLGIIFVASILTPYSLLPMSRSIMYNILVRDGPDFSATISGNVHNGDDSQNYKIVSSAFISMFIDAVEGYKYESLQTKLRFIKNNATKLIFNKYYDSLSLDNPNSPILKYQKTDTKNITISSIEHISTKEAVVHFVSQTSKNTGIVYETQNYRANITFDMDEIMPKTQEDDRFFFAVTSYNTTLLGKKDAEQ